MNASDVLQYGHDFVMRNLDLPMEHWDTPNVCGVWSVKDIIAHLASFEYVLVEVLTSFVGKGPTPYLEQVTGNPQEFNDFQVGIRTDRGPAAVLAEYEGKVAETLGLITEIPAEVLRRAGTLPWYGAEYALDDYIVYQFYGHKREHTSQINVFKDALKAAGQLPAAAPA